MNNLVGKLLGMTRLESPGVRLNKEWFPLEDIVGSALTRLEPLLREHTVITVVPADIPLVHVDGVLVEEVLVNLLENAARYTPTGSTIEIRAGATPEGARVEVLDNGPGLKAGAETRLFDKFVRDRPDTDRRGTGLGLAICRAIMRLHGGEIGAHNRAEGGACFWFTIPQSIEPAPAALKQENMQPVAQTSDSQEASVSAKT